MDADAVVAENAKKDPGGGGGKKVRMRSSATAWARAVQIVYAQIAELDQVLYKK